ncbi:MAG: hypothetical protein DSY42_05140 [Aquifex sp.]|nr:MAG: hypothetical protein DSY42_05140 [Aquifex sp.]
MRYFLALCPNCKSFEIVKEGEKFNLFAYEDLAFFKLALNKDNKIGVSLEWSMPDVFACSECGKIVYLDEYEYDIEGGFFEYPEGVYRSILEYTEKDGWVFYPRKYNVIEFEGYLEHFIEENDEIMILLEAVLNANGIKPSNKEAIKNMIHNITHTVEDFIHFYKQLCNLNAVEAISYPNYLLGHLILYLNNNVPKDLFNNNILTFLNQLVDAMSHYYTVQFSSTNSDLDLNKTFTINNPKEFNYFLRKTLEYSKEEAIDSDGYPLCKRLEEFLNYIAYLAERKRSYSYEDIDVFLKYEVV